MTTALTLDLPTDIYEALTQIAQSASLTPEQWIVTSLRRQLTHPLRDPNLRRHFGVVNLGMATGLDNHSIDADLAHQYTAVREG